MTAPVSSCRRYLESKPVSLVDLSAVALLEELRRSTATAVEAATAYLDRIERLNPEVNAFVRVDRERVLTDAASIDRRRTRKEELGPLAGLPIAVKDLLCTEGEPTTCGSRMLRD